MILGITRLRCQGLAHLGREFAAGRGTFRDLGKATLVDSEISALALGVERPGLVVGVQYLLLGDVIGDRGAGDALRHDLPIPVLLGDDVVLGVLVAEPLHHLGMGRKGMEALDESLAGDLPVAVDDAAEVRVDDAVGVVPALPVIEHRAQEGLE